jgi:uncharacterized damage-inducible protein DinB
MLDTLQHLFGFKAWANDELLTTLAELDEDSPVTGLAIQALSHTYIVDRIFAAHLRREPHPYRSANASVPPMLGDLASDIRGSDLDYLGYVAWLDRHQLEERIGFTFTDGAPGRMSRAEMLMHVITHGVGHRGQISALLLLNKLPPAKDGFTTWLHEAEAATRRRLAA